MWKLKRIPGVWSSECVELYNIEFDRVGRVLFDAESGSSERSFFSTQFSSIDYLSELAALDWDTIRSVSIGADDVDLFIVDGGVERIELPLGLRVDFPRPLDRKIKSECAKLLDVFEKLRREIYSDEIS